MIFGLTKSIFRLCKKNTVYSLPLHYRLGDEYRSSDDGEPSGTAGRPMLSAIDGEGLDAVCVLVVRHFGGVKLGAGGLARAYGGAARQCLQQALRTFRPAKALCAFCVQ